MTLAPAQALEAAKVAEQLSQAGDVQQVLAYVVGALLVALIAVVTWHLKQQESHRVEVAALRDECRDCRVDAETKRESLHERNRGDWLKIYRSLSELTGMADEEDNA